MMYQVKGPNAESFYKVSNHTKNEDNISLSSKYRTAAEASKKTINKSNSVLFSPEIRPRMKTSLYGTNEK